MRKPWPRDHRKGTLSAGAGGPETMDGRPANDVSGIGRGGIPDLDHMLALAAEAGGSAEFSGLVQAGADPQAALFTAASRGFSAAVRRLISAGVDLAAADCAGLAALHLAALADCGVSITALITAGADRDARTLDGLEATPLHLAARAGRPDAIMALVEAGADAEAADAGGMTAQALAFRSGNIEAVSLMAQAVAGWPLRKMDQRERRKLQRPRGAPFMAFTLLISAAAARRPEEFSALICAGADRDAALEMIRAAGFGAAAEAALDAAAAEAEGSE